MASTYRARVEIQHRKPLTADERKQGVSPNPLVTIKAGDPVTPDQLGANQKDMKELLKRGTIEELNEKGQVISAGFGPAVVPPRDVDPDQHKPAEEMPSVQTETQIPGTAKPEISREPPKEPADKK